MASSLNGVTDVAVITDPVACEGGTLRRKVMSSLLPRLGTLGQLIRAVARGVAAASHRLQGMNVGAPSIGGGRRLG
jgi:hypothetical protein